MSCRFYSRIRKRKGFTLVEIMIVVTIIGMLAALAIPLFAKARRNAQEEACINNLRIIDGAKQQWGMENFQPVTAMPAVTDIDPYLKGGTAKCFCPADSSKSFGSSYTINDLATEPECKIFPIDHSN